MTSHSAAQTERLKAFYAQWTPQVEAEMQSILANGEGAVHAHYAMMHYHMGWVNADFAPEKQPSGKLVRPMVAIMAAEAVGGDPLQALPAAAGIEILHNFSLVHDDLEDGDETRRHRATVWKVWGMPQAVNVGDAMHALAFSALHRLPQRGVSADRTLAALGRLTQTCIALTEGQHLDMSFESRDLVSVDEYLRMIRGKTAALLAASAGIGSMIASGDPDQECDLYGFGLGIGLAFQIQDDILGIWGDPAVTGKAAGNDILRRKKSFPLLYALNHPRWGEEVQQLWSQGIQPEDLPVMLDLLAKTEAREVAQAQVHVHHQTGLDWLIKALGDQAEASLLWAMGDALLVRSR